LKPGLNIPGTAEQSSDAANFIRLHSLVSDSFIDIGMAAVGGCGPLKRLLAILQFYF
jgi:hypothetical protein